MFIEYQLSESFLVVTAIIIIVIVVVVMRRMGMMLNLVFPLIRP